ncbi:MAG: flagellar export protein FliJ [Eubacterium sp.]|nr:flagellar export protein FliJ [Eubacterium sp.]
MAKFTYHMQNILDIKCKLETQAKSAFAQANMRLRREEDRLQTLKSRKMIYEIKAKTLMKDRLNVPEIKRNRQAIDTMERAILMQVKVLASAQKEVDEARNRLKEIMIDRKTHEKLKEKEFEEFLFELGQEENKQVDELVSYQFHAKPNES